MMRDRKQLTDLCVLLTNRARSPDQLWSLQGPTDAAIDVLEDRSPLSNGEQTLVLIAFAIWNGAGPFGRLMDLDHNNFFLVGSLFSAIAEGDTAVDEWIRKNR